MRLDNRSRSIVISGEGMTSTEAQASVKDFYESHGATSSVGEDGLVFTYPSRETAEKVCLFLLSPGEKGLVADNLGLDPGYGDDT
jgi:hypothetical protein